MAASAANSSAKNAAKSEYARAIEIALVVDGERVGFVEQ